MERNVKKLHEIDLSKDGVFYIKNGKINIVDTLPYGYGTQTITWQDGKVVRTELAYSRKV